jgi:acylphosphatase
MRRRVRAIVTGRVQGVSYRASTIFEARRLGLSGWVRNCSDGSVELECEGDGARVQRLLTWCEHGPPGAVVARVAVEDLSITDDASEFMLRV